MKRFYQAVALVGFLFSVGAHASSADDVEKIRAELSKMIPQASDAKITPSPAEGVYQIEIDGNYTYTYISGDYILMGGLYNSKDKSNLGAEAKSAYSLKKLNEVPLEEMIVFGPKDAKTYINVFTDVSCGYCRKLHNEVSDLTDAGIQVRYLAWPRAGIGSSDYNKYENVWCSKDQQSALTDAKNNFDRSVQGKPASCETPVAAHWKLGRQLGVNGTPMIYLEDGTLVEGYRPAKQLIEMLGLDG